MSRVALLAVAMLACSTPQTAPGPDRYRLAGSGVQWQIAGDDHVLEDLQPRYPDFFAALMDRTVRGDYDTRPLRRDLEHGPVDRRNYDALNAIAIGYFELNHRAESDPGGPGYFDDSFRAAKLLAIPWKAYGLVPDPALRDAILDFFEDAGGGEKLASRGTAPRLARVVSSLEAKEQDPSRLERIRSLVLQLQEAEPQQP